MYRNNFRKFFAVLLSLTMMLSMKVALFADLTDVSSHWAKDEIQYLTVKGVVGGYSDGEFKPDKTITRAEFFKMLNKIFGYSNKAQVSFDDVKDTDWYYEEIQKAVEAGYVSGYPDNTIRPNEEITRQEVAKVIALAFGLNYESSNFFHLFEDDDQMASWARPYIGALYNKGFVSGYQDGTYRPENNLTRGEAAKILSNAAGVLYNIPGTYVKNAEGNVIVNTTDITLKDMTIKGDLYLTEGIGEGNVTLDGITVEGTTFIRGGGENSIHIKNSSLKDVSVAKTKKNVRVVVSGEKSIQNLIMDEKTIVVIEEGVTIHNLHIKGQGRIELAKGATIEKLAVNSPKVEIMAKGIIGNLQANVDVTVNDKKIKKGEQVAIGPDKKEKQDTNSGGTNSGEPSTPSTEVKVTEIQLDKTAVEIKVGNTLQLTATVSPTNATNKNVTWTTNNANVATVNNGLVTAVAEGKATITATADGKIATATIIVVPALADGEDLILEDMVATVSSSEAFAKALGLETVQKIQVLQSIKVNEPVNKTVVIPENTNEIVLDFGDNEVKELVIEGDNNTIQNAIIAQLTIESMVENLELSNIRDQEHSEHIFKGGGGNSIKLQGNTTFKGKVKITSGTDIQIRAESEDAKIEGIVSVESGAKTTISAPVSHLVVNTEDSNVVVNATINKMAVRKNATITVKEGIQAPIIEARIGTTVKATDEKGEEVQVQVEYRLDTYELDLNIREAEYKIENVPVGSYDGNVSVDAKEMLVNALEEAKKALENKEATKENQGTIDEATVALQKALQEFGNNMVKVNRSEIIYRLHEISLFLMHIDIGEEVGSYPKEAYEEFKVVVDDVREFLRGDQVTQEAVNTRLEQLQEVFEKFKSSKRTSTETEGIANFVIKGDAIKSWNIETNKIRGKGKRSNFWDRLHHIEENLVQANQEEGRLIVEIKFDELHKYEEFVIPARINDGEYQVFLRITSEEIKQGQIKEVSLEDFVAIDVSMEGKTLQEYRGNIYLLDENGEDIANIWFGRNGEMKIQSGKYSICYWIEEKEVPYYMYTPAIDVGIGNNKFEFRQEDFVKIELQLSQKNPYNYVLKSVAPIKYSTTTFLNLNNENPVFYLSKGIYRNMIVSYMVEIEENKYELEIHTNYNYTGQEKIDIKEDRKFEYSDDFKIDLVRWNNIEDPNQEVITIYDKQQPLSQNGSYELMNDLGQRGRFYKINVDESMDYSYQLKYVVQLKTNDNEYTKEVIQEDLNRLTFEDIVGEDLLEGEFTLEISAPEIPTIKPYVQKIKFEKEDQV